MPPTPLVPPLDLATAPAGARAAAAVQARDVAPLTNMRRTLLHTPPAFDALVMWYALRDAVRSIVSERATVLFAHAVSAETDGLICSTFFRRVLVESGGDLTRSLSADEAELVTFARARRRRRPALGWGP